MSTELTDKQFKHIVDAYNDLIKDFATEVANGNGSEYRYALLISSRLTVNSAVTALQIENDKQGLDRTSPKWCPQD